MAKIDKSAAPIKQPKTQVHFQMDTALWRETHSKAAAKGLRISDLARAFLETWTAQDQRMIDVFYEWTQRRAAEPPPKRTRKSGPA